ncbi:MAG: hypothetical protein MI863_19965 [Desulfobacterales bacterium]|nr:hypothetical protein [Desulfobacterales bacterium]
MSRKILFVTTMVLAIALFSQRGVAEDITWPYICFSPLYICENDRLTGGYAHDILNVIWRGMPEDNHVSQMMPIKRMLTFARQGKHQLFYGLYKTPEREKFLYYSIPCRISVPPFIVVRKEDVSGFAKGDTASLDKLLSNPGLNFLLLKSVSFGKKIDGILEKHCENPQISIEYDTTDMGAKSLKLLTRKRVDYFLSLDGTVNDAKEMGIIDRLAFLHIEEQNKYEVGYITAPRTPWGRKKIQQVNTILRQEIPKPYFFKLFTPLVSDTMKDELRRQFNTSVLEPAKTAL